MNYVKSYLKRNKMTREQLAAMTFSSVSLIDKVAAGFMKLSPKVKRIMQLEEEKKNKLW